MRNRSACAPGRGSSAVKHVSRRPFAVLRLLDGALGLQVEVAQEQLVVGGEIGQRRQHAGLFVVVVIRAATIWPWAAADSA